MPKVIRIKKGLNIRLLGEAEKVLPIGFTCPRVAVKPGDFLGVYPKMLVQEGDQVKAGTPLFYDKYRDYLKFTAPASGRISEIKRGEKRKIFEIKIDADSETSYIDFGKADPNSLGRNDIIKKLLDSGLWAHIRQRPYSIIANPADIPKAIHISCFDTSPLAPDNDYIVHGKGQLFQAGLDTLRKLTDGDVHLNLHEAHNFSKVFLNSKKVQINFFKGPHPAGNVGVQIHHIDPINKGDIVWYLHPQDVITIGRLFIEGVYNSEKIIALTGSEILKPKYFKILNGSCINSMVENNVIEGNKRYISGNVLTGKKIEPGGYVGFYHTQVTVIPEGDYYELLGWAMPGFNKFSLSKSFFSWLAPGKKYRLDTNLHGGQRAYVITGQYEKVFPMKIYPVQLIKAIMIQDIDLMENLGIYEVDEEDFALCEYVCTSKTEVQSIVRQGIDLMRKEMS